MLKQEFIHSHYIVAIFCGWEAQKPTKTTPEIFLKLEEDGKEPEFVYNNTVLEELPYATDWNYLLAAWAILSDQVKEANDKRLTSISTQIANSILKMNLQIAFRELVRCIETLNQINLEKE